MTGVETYVAVASWAVTLIALAAVILLYRQVDLFYRQSEIAALTPHEVGARVPAIEVLGSDGAVGWFECPSTGVWAAVFLRPGCADCESLLADLLETDIGVRVEAFITSGEFAAGVRSALETATVRIGLYGIVNPFRLVEDWRVGAVPFAYVLVGDSVVGAGSVKSAQGLKELLSAGAEDPETPSVQTA